MKRLNGRLKALILAVVAMAALTAATQALAVDQTPKNGCTSPDPYSGAITSPGFATPSPTAGSVSFSGWFDIESIDPIDHDVISVQYSLFNPDGPRDWIEFGRLNPTSQTDSAEDRGYSNLGFSTTPDFQSYDFPLPSEAAGQSNVQVRILFDSVDGAYQGFRGVGIDAVTIPDASDTSITEDFEGGTFPTSTGWAADGAAGPGTPFWHVIDNSNGITVRNPEINPDLVTLLGGDSGALPATSDGTHYAWFGDNATGTFCGPDFANRVDTAAPETTITDGPGSSASTSASISFQSSEPGSSFQCSLDGSTFSACSSPVNLSGLTRTTHSFQVFAVDALGNSDPTPAVHNWTITPPRSVNDLPVPTIGENVNIQELKGQVKVDLAGGRRQFVALSEARQIPVGSTLDARKGTVRLQSANSQGKRKNGDFSRGIFQVKQSKKKSLKARTDLVLKGGNFKKCATASSGQASAALSKRAIRRLRSKAKGGHRSSGKRSAATVRGTTWTVTDRCDGTLTTVQSGSVRVRDFRRKKTVTVRRGKRYLAKAPPNSKRG